MEKRKIKTRMVKLQFAIITFVNLLFVLALM